MLTLKNLEIKDAHVECDFSYVYVKKDFGHTVFEFFFTQKGFWHFSKASVTLRKSYWNFEGLYSLIRH